MTKRRYPGASAGYFVEGWNIFSVPMMALIEYRQTLFPIRIYSQNRAKKRD